LNSSAPSAASPTGRGPRHRSFWKARWT
jgi:hypothetical protein